eukprot:5335680-Amphidinium_carterae.1
MRLIASKQSALCKSISWVEENGTGPCDCYSQDQPRPVIVGVEFPEEPKEFACSDKTSATVQVRTQLQRTQVLKVAKSPVQVHSHERLQVFYARSLNVCCTHAELHALRTYKSSEHISFETLYELRSCGAPGEK